MRERLRIETLTQRQNGDQHKFVSGGDDTRVHVVGHLTSQASSEKYRGFAKGGVATSSATRQPFFLGS
jgi:hypothetical protein